MTKLRLLALSTVSALIACGGVLVACSSDDTVITGTDAGPDATGDTFVPDSPEGDAGEDADAAPPFDGGVTNFVEELAQSLCRTTARCCFGDTDPPDGSVDGGSFDKEHCLEIYRNLGWENSNKYMGQTDPKSLVLDNQKAGDCLSGIDNLTCTVPGATVATLRTACYGAFHGAKAAGDACATSLDCAQGLFCNPNADGGAPSDGGTSGKCEAIRPVGGSCGDVTADLTKVDEACSWRGQGGDEHCQIYSDFATATQAPQDQWKCEAANAVGGDCDNDAWCAAAICDPATFQCTSPFDNFPPSSCATFVKP
jgi:hypothetical protein